MNNEPVRFGLIGYGLFGAHHANLIAKLGNAELASIAVKSNESGENARREHPGAEVVDDYRRMLERDDIEAVSVVTPNHLHYEVGRAALEAGKHVLMEKPLALSLAQCDELVELARRNERVLAVNHELRLSSLWGRVKQLIDEGAIGRPLYALVELSRFPYRQGSDNWRYDLGRVGNWILEEPIHFFDLARWYMASCGEPESVYARANGRRADHPELQDNFSATVNYAGGQYALVSQTLGAFGHYQTAKIAGTEGAIWAHWGAADARSPDPTFSLQYGLGDDVRVIDFPQMTGELVELEQQLAEFADCIRLGQTPTCTGADGRWSTLLCLAAAESAERGELVSIEKYIESQSDG